MQRGSAAEAGVQYAEALRLDPNLDVANVGMGMMLVREGNAMGGRNYCTEALRSSDSDIREEAAACLRGQDK
jgi:Flp pilus assembly protein TadD